MPEENKTTVPTKETSSNLENLPDIDVSKQGEEKTTAGQAVEEATANKDSPAATTSSATETSSTSSPVINDSTYLTPQDVATLTGLDATAFLSEKQRTDRQRVFNGKKSINDVKIPNAGKPLNNNDPYPIDKKIKELETHSPRVKKNSISWVHEEQMSKDLLDVADYTEKRLVKLENILATVMRYVFAIASRVPINCQYYGGQDHRAFKIEKLCA